MSPTAHIRSSCCVDLVVISCLNCPLEANKTAWRAHRKNHHPQRARSTEEMRGFRAEPRDRGYHTKACLPWLAVQRNGAARVRVGTLRTRLCVNCFTDTDLVGQTEGDRVFALQLSDVNTAGHRSAFSWISPFTERSGHTR